ncbi:MAG: hypothetical protein ACK57W_03735, partial [Flavobacteriales bacterium]
DEGIASQVACGQGRFTALFFDRLLYIMLIMIKPERAIMEHTWRKVHHQAAESPTSIIMISSISE